jgi:hypothetical protein
MVCKRLPCRCGARRAVVAGAATPHGNQIPVLRSGSPPSFCHHGHPGIARLRGAHARAASMRNQGRPGVRIGQALPPHRLPAKAKLPFVRVPSNDHAPEVRALHLPEAGEIDFVAPARCMKILPPKIVWRLKKDHQHSSAAAAGFSRPACVRRQADRGLRLTTTGRKTDYRARPV